MASFLSLRREPQSLHEDLPDHAHRAVDQLRRGQLVCSDGGVDDGRQQHRRSRRNGLGAAVRAGAVRPGSSGAAQPGIGVQAFRPGRRPGERPHPRQHLQRGEPDDSHLSVDLLG